MPAKLIPPLLVLLFLASNFLPSAEGGHHPVNEPLKLSDGHLQVDWAVDRDHERDCGGKEIAGGASSGQGNFTHIGHSTIEVSAAWDIGNQLNPKDAQFDPIGPAGDAVAPVLGTDAYPYAFQFNPLTRKCGAAAMATGAVTITAANGDQVFGKITGGETFRLDFKQFGAGDGVETFAKVTIRGGTGRFKAATGSFVTHTITRFDYDADKFVIDLVEVLPGGTIAY